MKSLFYRITICLVISFLCLPTTIQAVQSTPSDWAKSEVGEADMLAFVPWELLSDYQKNITRSEFCKLTIGFVAMQYGYDIEWFLTRFYNKLSNGNNTIYSNLRFAKLFTDKTEPDNPYPEWIEYANIAYYMGIIEGENGKAFEPNSPITGQEAAAMLTKAYEFYSNKKINASGIRIDDAGKSALWVKDDTGDIETLLIMNGADNQHFDPLDYYTREQSIAILVMLYKNASVSRSKGNVIPFSSYEEEINEMQKLYEGDSEQSFELDNYTIKYYSKSGMPHAPNNKLFIFYKSGGFREIISKFPPINAWGTTTTPDDISFDEKGQMMYFFAYDASFDKTLKFEVTLSTGKLLRSQGQDIE